MRWSSGWRMMSSSIADREAADRQIARRRPFEGGVEIAFAVAPDGRTFVDRQLALYPFHLCRVLSVPGDPAGFATLYLQSCSGGIYEDDRHRIDIRAAAGAKAHVTTQASTIVHGMQTGGAVQEVALEAGEGALLEYLPDPLILFAGARLDAQLRIRAHPTARTLAAESFILHDPAGGDGVFERLGSRTEVEDASGALLACDRYSIAGAELRDLWPGIAAGFRAQGTLWLIGGDLDPEPILPAVRGALASRAGVYAGVSLLPARCGLLARLLAADGAALRAAMTAAWQTMRLALTGAAPQPRRK